MAKPQKGDGALKKTPRDVGPLVLERPAGDKKLILEIRGDSKTIVDWVNGHAELEEVILRLPRISCCNGGAVELTCGVVWLIGRHISFVNTTKKLTSGRGKESKAVKENGLILRMWCGLKLPACAGFGTVAANEARAVRGS